MDDPKKDNLASNNKAGVYRLNPPTQRALLYLAEHANMPAEAYLHALILRDWQRYMQSWAQSLAGENVPPPTEP